MDIKWKRHYRLLGCFVLVVVALVAGLGSTRIRAYTVKGGDVAEPIINHDNSIALFDSTVVHEIQLLIAEGDLEQMLLTYQETGAKEYFHADVIIDGVRVNDVGIRLKGNASLQRAGGGMGPGGGRGPMGGQPPGGDGRQARPEGAEMPQPPEGFELPEIPEGGEAPQFPGGMEMPEVPEGFEAPQFPGGMQMPERSPFPGGPGGAGFPGGMAGGGQGQTALPYLIKFDEYVEGQRYQGYAEIALRTSGISTDAAQLQEPVSNAVSDLVGIPAADTAFISLQFNEETPQLYHIAEQIDQLYIDRTFPGSDGVLYKVTQVGNSFTYLGEDPTLYADSFDQKTAVNEADLAPLISFIRFVNEASDEEFVAELPARLDVAAFADYLAIHNLLANYDSLAGMGNNYYLYYDFDSAQMTILSWDTNEGLGKLGMGGSAQMDIYWEGVGSRFGGMFDPDQGGEAARPQRGPGGRGGGNHRLEERFLATERFRELYKERYRLLYEQIYGKDLITVQIEALATTVTAYNEQNRLVDQESYDAAVQSLLNIVQGRHDYLQSVELLQ